MIPVVKLDAMPSVGALIRFQDSRNFDRSEERADYIRSTFAPKGGHTYFGSSADRYADAFGKTISQVYLSSRRANKIIRDSVALFSNTDEIRPCVTEGSLSRLPPIMYKSILSHRPLYNLFRQGRVQGFGELTIDDIKPEVQRYRRLIDLNGTIQFNERHQQDQPLVWTFSTADPDLSVQDIIDIKKTREYVDYILSQTELDPTDLNTIRS